MSTIHDLNNFSRPTNSQLNLNLYDTTGAVTGCPGALSNIAGARGDAGNSLYMTGGKKKSKGKYKRMPRRLGRKVYRGGGYGFSSQPQNSSPETFGGGPTGHLAQFESYNNNAVSNPCNMNAHTEYTPQDIANQAASSGYITGGKRRRSRRRRQPRRRNTRKGGRKVRKNTNKHKRKRGRFTRKGGGIEDEIEKLKRQGEKLESRTASLEKKDSPTSSNGSPKEEEEKEENKPTTGMLGDMHKTGLGFLDKFDKFRNKKKSKPAGVCPPNLLTGKGSNKATKTYQCLASADGSTYRVLTEKDYKENWDDFKAGKYNTPGCIPSEKLGAIDNNNPPTCISMSEREVETQIEKKNTRPIECRKIDPSDKDSSKSPSSTPTGTPGTPTGKPGTKPPPRVTSSLLSGPPPPPLPLPKPMAPMGTGPPPGLTVPPPGLTVPPPGLPGPPPGLPVPPPGLTRPSGPPPGLLGPPPGLSRPPEPPLGPPMAPLDLGPDGAPSIPHLTGGRRKTKRKGKKRASRKGGKKGRKKATRRTTYYDFNKLKRALYL